MTTARAARRAKRGSLRIGPFGALDVDLQQIAIGEGGEYVDGLDGDRIRRVQNRAEEW
jgi:hypothetical protein